MILLAVGKRSKRSKGLTNHRLHDPAIHDLSAWTHRMPVFVTIYRIEYPHAENMIFIINNNNNKHNKHSSSLLVYHDHIILLTSFRNIIYPSSSSSTSSSYLDVLEWKRRWGIVPLSSPSYGSCRRRPDRACSEGEHRHYRHTCTCLYSCIASHSPNVIDLHRCW
jgi:hypothetical protein